MVVIAGAIFCVLLAGCDKTSVRSGTPYPSGTPDVADIAVDFFQEEKPIGKLYINTRGISGDFVRFLIQVPIIDAEDYRLDSVMFEFMSDEIQPVIMLEPATGTLTQNISFIRVGSVVWLTVPDTGRHGDGTILFSFLAEKQVFKGDGLRLHAELEFGAGDAGADLLIPSPVEN